MALVTQGKNSRIRSFYGDIKTTAETAIYTCPPNCTAEITYLHVVNADGNTSVTIKWYVAAEGYPSNFLTGKNMGSGEFITFSPMQLILQPGDQIRVTTSIAGHMDLIGTVIETFVPVG